MACAWHIVDAPKTPVEWIFIQRGLQHLHCHARSWYPTPFDINEFFSTASLNPFCYKIRPFYSAFYRDGNDRAL